MLLKGESLKMEELRGFSITAARFSFNALRARVEIHFKVGSSACRAAVSFAVLALVLDIDQTVHFGA